jgi:hypothetical protein
MSRKVKVNKKELIKEIKANREKHIKSYKKGVKAYTKEALKQLADLKKDANDGSLDLRLNLVTPIDNTEKYDKLIKQFEWDTTDFIDLEQHEFNEYIFDETQFAREAMVSNTFYMNR